MGQDRGIHDPKASRFGQLLVVVGVCALFGAGGKAMFATAVERVDITAGQRQLGRLAYAVSSYRLDAGETGKHVLPQKLATLTTPINYLRELPQLDTEDWGRLTALSTAGEILRGATETPNSLAFDCGCDAPTDEDLFYSADQE